MGLSDNKCEKRIRQNPFGARNNIVKQIYNINLKFEGKKIEDKKLG